MTLSFVPAKTEKDYKLIHEHNTDAFSDTPDFNWSLEEIKKEVSAGWDVIAVKSGEEIVAAVFVKLTDGILYSKNTSLKMGFQGVGISHEIKDFIETRAKELDAKKVIHYCRIDNFRMYSLNESHGFKKTGNHLGEDIHVVEWEKTLKK